MVPCHQNYGQQIAAGWKKEKGVICKVIGYKNDENVQKSVVCCASRIDY